MRTLRSEDRSEVGILEEVALERLEEVEGKTAALEEVEAVAEGPSQVEVVGEEMKTS